MYVRKFNMNIERLPITSFDFMGSRRYKGNVQWPFVYVYSSLRDPWFESILIPTPILLIGILRFLLPPSTSRGEMAANQEQDY